MLGTVLFLSLAAANPSDNAVYQALDGFHAAAAKAQFDTYFSYLTGDAVFIGTDAGERWTREEFAAYVKPHFAKGHGWTYTARSRHVAYNPEHTVAWFDEILDSASYGTARGSGVLLKGPKDWKIAQYHLTFPIPNDLAGKMTTEIKAFEAKKSK